MIKAVGFDLDGTLVDTFPGLKSSIESAFEEVLGAGSGFTVDRSHIGPPIRRILANILGSRVPEGEITAIEGHFRRIYDGEGWKGCNVYPEVMETLARLREGGIAAFVVTNKPRGPTGLMLAHTGIDGMLSFHVSIDSRESRFGSKGEMLADAIKSGGFDPGFTLFVGDTEEDFSASVSCNVRFVYAQYGYGKRDFAPPAAIARMGELVPMISNMI